MELYRSSAEEAESKVREMMAGVERLQKLVEDATQERDQLSVQLAEEESRYVCLSVCCLSIDCANESVYVHVLHLMMELL